MYFAPMVLLFDFVERLRQSALLKKSLITWRSMHSRTSSFAAQDVSHIFH